MKKNTVQLNESQLKKIVSESVKKVLSEISYDFARKAYQGSIDRGDYMNNPNKARNFYFHLKDRASQKFNPDLDVIVCGGPKEGNYKAGDLDKYFEITGYVEPSQNNIYNNSILIGAPRIKGYIGPMNDGGKLRYETQRNI